MISEQTLSDIATQINQAGALDDQVVSDLRAKFEGVHFTYCSDDDICDITPMMEQEGFNLYLINGHNHCLTMTKDFEAATGVVVAEVYPE